MMNAEISVAFIAEIHGEVCERVESKNTLKLKLKKKIPLNRKSLRTKIGHEPGRPICGLNYLQRDQNDVHHPENHHTSNRKHFE